MKKIFLNDETTAQVLQILKNRGGSAEGFEKTVVDIVSDVRSRGDEALFSYTEKFDHCALDESSIRVTPEEIEEALEQVDANLKRIMQRSADRIRDYHEKQVRQSIFSTSPDGAILGQRITAIERVGVYVPGGKAAYPSSTLMNIIPAKVAGVDNIIVCTPPGKDGKIAPSILAAAHIAGADVIYKVGGAQAVAAMAYGTKSIPKVDKIVGPGNIFVALAKKTVYGDVSIDSVAGPSEVLVLADETAKADFVAADLLSQAEHDEMASAILVTTCEELACRVSDCIDGMLDERGRRGIIEKSLEDFGFLLIAKDMEQACDMVNAIASEHLEIITKDPWQTMTAIRNAGAIFLGEYSCEPLGDYMAGPNHVLPTNGTARFFSPLSVDDFIKKSSVISFSQEALSILHEDIECFARAEGLDAHAASVAQRFKEDD